MARNLKPDDQPYCTDPAYDKDMWFPEPEPRRGVGAQGEEFKLNIAQALEALELCNLCPIRKACLEYAFESLETVQYGIFGGTLPFERNHAIGAPPNKGNSPIWQRKIRAMANARGIPVPPIAKRGRPASLVSYAEKQASLVSRQFLSERE